MRVAVEHASRCLDPRTNARGVLGGFARMRRQFLVLDAGNVNVKVYAVEQGTADAAAVAVQGGLGATARTNAR